MEKNFSLVPTKKQQVRLNQVIFNWQDYEYLRGQIVTKLNPQHAINLMLLEFSYHQFQNNCIKFIIQEE